MKHLTLDEVRHVIDLAEHLNKRGGASGSWLDPSTQEGINAVVDYVQSPEHEALHDSIAVLTQEKRFELLALMSLGRGDGDEGFDSLVAYARKNSDAGDVDYIVEKSPSLPMYFRQGLARLGLA